MNTLRDVTQAGAPAYIFPQSRHLGMPPAKAKFPIDEQAGASFARQSH
jgi:hypothetical protein